MSACFIISFSCSIYSNSSVQAVVCNKDLYIALVNTLIKTFNNLFDHKDRKKSISDSREEVDTIQINSCFFII